MNKTNETATLKDIKSSSYNANLAELHNILGQIESLYKGSKDKDTLQKSMSLMSQLAGLDLPIDIKIAEIGKFPSEVTEGLKKTWEISKSSKTYAGITPHVALAQYYVDTGISLKDIPEIRMALQSEDGMNNRYVRPHRQITNKHRAMYDKSLHMPCETKSDALKIANAMDQQANANRNKFINIAKELETLSKDPTLSPKEKEILKKTFQAIIDRTAIENKKNEKEIKRVEKELKHTKGPKRIVLERYLSNLQKDQELSNRILEQGRTAGITPQVKGVISGKIKDQLNIVSPRDMKLRNQVRSLLEEHGQRIDVPQNSSMPSNTNAYGR